MGLPLFSNRTTQRVLSNITSGNLTDEGISPGKRSGSASALESAALHMLRGLRPLIRVVGRLAERLFGRMEQLQQSSDDVSEHAAAVNERIRFMALGIQETAEHTQGAAVNLTDVHQQLQAVMEAHRQLAASSNSLSAEVGQGQRDMAQAMARTQEVLAGHAAVETRMESVAEAFSHIHSILEWVREVSAQTQLLSLNANIEAARAGEHGKGFAVVAREISQLAEQTKDAVGQIQQQLARVKGSTEDLQAGIRQMKTTAENSVGVMEEANSRYLNIVSYLEQTRSRIEQANLALERIESAAAHASSAMQSISAMMEESAASTEEILATVETQETTIRSMHEQIQEARRNSLSLNSAVSQFKLPPLKLEEQLQLAAYQWIESALQVRGLMVIGFGMADEHKRAAWHQELNRHDQYVQDSFHALENVFAAGREDPFIRGLEVHWSRYIEARNRNVALILEGELERAKEGVVNEARLYFKQAMDLMNEWLEASRQ